MIRTLVADRDSTTRLGICSVLGMLEVPMEIDEASNSSALLMRLHAHYYELILIDPTLLCDAPAACIRYLREAAPWSDVLVFTELDELTHGVGTIRGGAKGYLMKTCSMDQFAVAVRRVARGKIYLSRALAAEFATGLRRYDSRSQPHEALGTREFQILSMLARRTTVAEIAHVLRLDTATVHAFKTSVMDKLHAATPDDIDDYVSAHRLQAVCRELAGDLWSERLGLAPLDGCLPT
jgi:two-component system invasion response regulator UvrY